MKKKSKAIKPSKKRVGRIPLRRRAALFCLRWLGRLGAGFAVLMVIGVVAFSFMNPPTTPYMFTEGWRLGKIDQTWVPFRKISPAVVRSVVAAEDANFCFHWGFDMAAIRAAIKDGKGRGASTLTQQVVKNLYLWQGRSWSRKAIEALMTPLVEIFWSKRRILEVYLNIAEFGEGVFGINAAAQVYFRVTPAQLTARQAALLVTVLPSPKRRDAAHPTARMRKRAAQIENGAAMIVRDGRATCFER